MSTRTVTIIGVAATTSNKHNAQFAVITYNNKMKSAGLVNNTS